MRVRAVNEKAVSKLIAYLTDLRKDLSDGIYVTGHHLQTKHAVSKSTYSVCQKLEVIVNQTWNNAFDADRKTAIKILEFLRQQSDKQSDQPISDLWIAEIAAIKLLLSEVRDNSKRKDNRSEGFKISERVYLAGQIAGGVYNRVFPFILNPSDGASFDEANIMIVKMTDDLINKLNQ